MAEPMTDPEKENVEDDTPVNDKGEKQRIQKETQHEGNSEKDVMKCQDLKNQKAKEDAVEEEESEEPDDTDDDEDDEGEEDDDEEEEDSAEDGDDDGEEVMYPTTDQVNSGQISFGGGWGEEGGGGGGGGRGEEEGGGKRAGMGGGGGHPYKGNIEISFLPSKELSSSHQGLTLPCKKAKSKLFTGTITNPSTPESDQCQISPTASPEILHHAVWRTWLFITYSDERWLYCKVSLPHLYNFSLKSWENVLVNISSLHQAGYDSGTTANLAVIRGNHLVVANVGDSRCVLCRNGIAIDMSIDHKPDDTIELQRIEKAGGKVTSDGRINGGLNLSRALGTLKSSFLLFHGNQGREITHLFFCYRLRMGIYE